ncbi:MAG TPA: glycoside hydrolase family 2 TIM barrel-domain containing protein [Opitutaceae bacterium]|nr:glycoside hydrolase family 2 TIM barrel-domain containing protein [Opitutaceae bacterium]
MRRTFLLSAPRHIRDRRGRLTALCAAAAVACAALAVSGRAAEPAAVPPAVDVLGGWSLQDIARVAQPGEMVSRLGFSERGWYRATVPGTVLTTLVNDGVYPEPLYGENNRPDRIPESLCRTSYWYRTEVTVPADFAGRRVWLNFDGINYTAQVWVNGRRVGDVRGAFVRGVFDITSLVQPGAVAAIAVLIQPPPHPGHPVEQTIAAGTGPNGGKFSKDGPTFICTQGWDWIPGIRDRDMGIWQKVSLSASGDVLVQDPLVTSHLPLPRTDEADVTVEATVRNLADTPEAGVLRGGFEGVEFSVPVSLAPHEARQVKLTPAALAQLHVSHPRLWWPNGYGRPELYHLRLEFASAGAVSDQQAVTFGIREITYAVPNSDNLTISVNGVPIMCRGGDWGMDEAMKRIPRERLEAQIRYHQLARCNMIRNWVGQSTGEDFYDLCDRYGIMVWDEFFEPNPSDSGRTNPKDGSEDVHDIPLYLANVRAKVLRYRNHPSIALWCGRNEGEPAPEAVADGLRRIMAELEPVRLYHPNSADGHGVRSGGPYYWRTPREYYLPPRRSYGPKVPQDPAYLEPFKTEIGSVSIPTLEAIQAMMPAKDWNTINDDWAEHDLCRGAQGGDRFPIELRRRYGKWKDLAGFTRESQLADYEAYRAMYEGRFARLFNPCTGVLTWMSNPSQPSFVWQFYSYDLEPLASLYAVRKACEPLHVQLNQYNFHLDVINQTPVAANGLTARIRVFALNGAMTLDRTVSVDARPSAATDAGPVPFPAASSSVQFIKLELRDRDGRLVSDNFYWRASDRAPDDFRALNTLPRVALTANATRHDADGQCRLSVTVTNPTRTIALMAHLQLRHGANGARVLPVYYDDNFVSLLPGESRTIEIEESATALAGGNPHVVIDGWNVTTAAQTFPDHVSVGPNPGMEPSK